MKAKFKLENPDEIQATIEITMTLKNWEDLSRQLANNYPASEFRSVISDVVNQSKRHFYPEKEL